MQRRRKFKGILGIRNSKEKEKENQSSRAPGPSGAKIKIPAATKKFGKSTKIKRKARKIITDAFKVKRKGNHFNGISEAEFLNKILPDILTFSLDIVILHINPGLMAATLDLEITSGSICSCQG